MGRIVYMLNVSLDGYVETPDRSLAWTHVDEELHTWFNDRSREAGGFVYGRRLYEVMAAYWPTAESDPSATPAMLEFARIWNATPKFVFSSTLTTVVRNSQLVHGDVGREVQRIRDEVDGDIDVGGPTLAAELVRRDLVDVYRLVIHPVTLGAGKPFFPTPGAATSLRLTEFRTFASGVVQLGYERPR